MNRIWEFSYFIWFRTLTLRKIKWKRLEPKPSTITVQANESLQILCLAPKASSQVRSLADPEEISCDKRNEQNEPVLKAEEVREEV